MMRKQQKIYPFPLILILIKDSILLDNNFEKGDRRVFFFVLLENLLSGRMDTNLKLEVEGMDNHFLALFCLSMI